MEKVNIFQYAEENSFMAEDLINVVGMMLYNHEVMNEDRAFFSYSVDIKVLKKAADIINYFDFERDE